MLKLIDKFPSLKLIYIRNDYSFPQEILITDAYIDEMT